MRKIRTTISLFIFINSALGQPKPEFHIQGFIKGADSGSFMYLVNNVTMDTISKSIIRNGRFKFNGSITHSPEWHSIRLEGSESWLTIFMDNSAVKINGSSENWAEAKVTGVTPNNDVLKYMSLTEPTINRFSNLQHKYRKNIESNDTAEIARVRGLLDQMSDSVFRIREYYIKNNPNSFYTAWLILNTYKYDEERLKLEYDRLTTDVKGSNYGMQLRDLIEARKLLSEVRIDNIVPNFSLIDLDGNKFTIADIYRNNKITLLDFWASWCKPCRQENPSLRKVYNDFRERGFNIVSITSDRNEIQWRRAISQDSMIWLHGRPEEGAINPFELFDITAIPAYILLDQKGRIIAAHLVNSSKAVAKDNLFGGNLFKKIDDFLNKSK